MNKIEVYAICDADSISPGWVQPFTLARAGADGALEPFPIVILRGGAEEYFAFVNSCPHEQHPLYDAPGQVPDSGEGVLICGKDGAKFQAGSGLCIEGPCKGARLESIPVLVLDGDVCIGGVTLVEEDEDGPPEVMVTSD
ncbi:MAG: Rieske 2Fe-2S domain-containing protein [Rhodomicrobium sp.]